MTAIDWRDSSLGCPKPGMAYLEVITPGHKVMLSVDGQVYAVHEAKNRAFVCKQAQAGGRIDRQQQLEYRRQMLTAQNDLARRLGVPVKEIHPVGGEKKTWDDASLDCPEEGVQYAQVETPGWVLTLRHGERDYTYHADARPHVSLPGHHGRVAARNEKGPPGRNRAALALTQRGTSAQGPQSTTSQ